jgi:hypothetical protein
MRHRAARQGIEGKSPASGTPGHSLALTFDDLLPNMTRLGAQPWRKAVGHFDLVLPGGIVGPKHRSRTGDAISGVGKAPRTYRDEGGHSKPFQFAGWPRDSGVERRNLKAVAPAPTPIASGRQGPFNDAARAPRPMRNPAPTAMRGLPVNCSHMKTLVQQNSRGLVDKVLRPSVPCREGPCGLDVDRLLQPTCAL